MHKNVNGQRVELTSDELVQRLADQAAMDGARTRNAALFEIDRLEGQITSRRLREATLGTDGGWLANQETLIAAERAKL